MLDIAIPKGSLEEQTILLFKQADLEIKKLYILLSMMLEG